MDDELTKAEDINSRTIIADVSKEMKTSYLNYAMSVIVSRALPDVRDGLKPVHRRILYDMYEMGLKASGSYKKCARIVGDVLGKYHPHGDASVYDALVRLAQDFSLRYPVVTPQGNFGSIDGDDAAAMRYTECRLSRFGQTMIENIDKNTVELINNFDDSEKEPTVLPTLLPNLLINGASGIAAGYATNIPTFNFNEVVDAIITRIDSPNCQLKSIMQVMPGPDFPTGGKIINGEDLLNIYTIGHGSVKVMAHYDITKKGNKTVLIFHDLPYGVDIDNGVKAPLKKLVIDEGYEVFEDINVEKVGNRQFDIKVTLSKDADVAKCLEILFNKTRLCDSIKINNTVIKVILIFLIFIYNHLLYLLI